LVSFQTSFFVLNMCEIIHLEKKRFMNMYEETHVSTVNFGADTSEDLIHQGNEDELHNSCTFYCEYENVFIFASFFPV